MRSQRGDTIVEVLFAVTVFSLVAVSGLSLMNQGTAMAQRSLEITQVRDQIDAQADALRYAHNAYIFSSDQENAPSRTIWEQITADEHTEASAQPFGAIASLGSCGDLPDAAFLVNPDEIENQDGSAIIEKSDISTEPVTFSRVLSDGSAEGIWVEAVESAGTPGATGYYDFHIRACWFAPGQAFPVTLGTIVRLHDARL